MKYFFYIVVILLLNCNQLTAQADADANLKITYYNADAGVSILHHINLLKETQKKRVEKGDILAWRFYRVLFSSNAAHRYGFVTVEISGH
jgi:hypothetical protein